MRSFIFAALLVLVGLGVTDLAANYLQARKTYRPEQTAVAADPALKPALPPTTEQE